MTVRDNVHALLHYENYDALPVVHFGYWKETLHKWAKEGHIPEADYRPWNWEPIAQQQGFDFEWGGDFPTGADLNPNFGWNVLEKDADGTLKMRNSDGVVVLQKPGAGSIPSEIEHLLVDRASWEEHYLPRLQYSAERIDREKLGALPAPAERAVPLCLDCGSLFGRIRDWLGLEGSSYLYADDEDLYDEIINTHGALVLRCAETVLQSGIQFDYAHLWEDICFKSGPLVIPSVFEEKVGPWYKKLTGLLNEHGIDIISLDCDGLIDALLPIWLENGVNTMFPIEVGTWHASIGPWREKYGRDLRGVGGMDKKVFAMDRAAIDAEIERLKPLIDPGGYIPCPDHRIPPDAKWDNVCYYAERLRKEFNG